MRRVGSSPAEFFRAAWEALLGDARNRTRCGLYKCATQMVFGEGPLDGPIMFVGEQPGDQEDLSGRPFVGPAGQLTQRWKAGIDRSRVYVTNAACHFARNSAASAASMTSPTGARSKLAGGGSATNVS